MVNRGAEPAQKGQPDGWVGGGGGVRVILGRLGERMMQKSWGGRGIPSDSAASQQMGWEAEAKRANEPTKSSCF